MKTDFDYSPYIYKKSVGSAPKKRYSKRQKLVIVICAFLIVVMLGVYLLRGNFFGSGGVIQLDKATYYSVSLGTFASEATAKAEAQKAQARGAGGYIVGGESFVVLASCYASKKDAESVVANLKKSSTNATIFALDLPSVRLVSASKRQEEVLEKALNAHGKIFDTLYTISVGIDKGESSHQDARTSLEALRETLTGITQEFDTLAEADITASVTHAKATINSIKNIVENINMTENLFDISVSLRYNYLKILFMFSELFKEIN